MNKSITELTTTLQRINNGEKFNFNLAWFQNKGLVTVKDVYKYDNCGNIIIKAGKKVVKDFTIHLTPKAKLFIKIA